MSVCQLGKLISPQGPFSCQCGAIHSLQQSSRRFRVGLAIWRSPKLGGLGRCSARRICINSRTIVHFQDNAAFSAWEDRIFCLLSLSNSWAVIPALPQISARLNWCAPAALQADRLYWSRVGHMLLGASALNFYSGSSGEERGKLQKWVYTVQDFLLEVWCNNMQEECNTMGV